MDAETGRRRLVRWLPALALVVAVACGSPDTDDLATAVAGAITRSSSSPAAAATPQAPPTSVAPAPAPTTVNRTTTFGTSVSGRPLTVTEIGNPASPNRILIVGCIHGNEPAGIAVADALAKAPPLANADLWLVPVLNPDGVSANTRQNANGVDLNRNFPFEWQPNGQRGAVEYGGPSALSEPESQAAATLIRVDPSDHGNLVPPAPRRRRQLPRAGRTGGSIRRHGRAPIGQADRLPGQCRRLGGRNVRTNRIRRRASGRRPRRSVGVEVRRGDPGNPSALIDPAAVLPDLSYPLGHVAKVVRVTVEDDEVGPLARLDRAEFGIEAQQARRL